MPVLETDFLKALIDPSDALHPPASKAASKVKENAWMIASSACLELDLLLKSGGISQGDRIETFEALEAELGDTAFLSLTPHIMAEAISLQSTYGATIRDFYFDSLHLATSSSLDRVIVSSDRQFRTIPGVQWVDLRRL